MIRGLYKLLHYQTNAHFFQRICLDISQQMRIITVEITGIAVSVSFHHQLTCTVARTLLCSPGLGAEASTSRKHTDGNRVFRVCGYKCIACTVAFVYTQALLAPLQNNSPNNSANLNRSITQIIF